jgi:hypothetical protein
MAAASLGVGSSGRIRTEDQPPTPADSNLLDPEPKDIWPTILLDQLGPILTKKRTVEGQSWGPRHLAHAQDPARLDLTLYVRIIQAWPFTVESRKSEEASVS